MHSSLSRTSALPPALAVLLLCIATPGAARADDAATAGVGVARVSVIQGAVAVQRGDSATPLAAAINAPVLGADYVTTGDGARAEIEFDGSSSVRLGAGVQMRFTHLDTGNRELQLAAGTIDLRLLRGLDGRSQIDTPSVSIRPRGTGSYRVSVDAAGRTQVTVRAGSADIVAPQAAQVLAAGTTLLAQGAAANPVLQTTEVLAYDDFDRFNRERDDPEQRALASLAYASPGVAGIDDLDTYGRWVTDGGYGRVWIPAAVASTWAPYRDGRWVWEEGYGWTWIGYEPWGWAPYHYGRWYHSTAYGWCWYPERAFVTWRPAVVAFLGFGGGFGFGFGDIGWVPLAPFEPYYAWGNRYGTNVTYVTNNYYYGNVNNGTVTVVGNGDHNHSRGFGNLRYNGGTFVAHQRFVDGDFVHAHPIDRSKIRAVTPVRGTVPALPSEANLRFSDRPVSAHLAVAPSLLGGTFAGNDIAVRRMPFKQQREELTMPVRAYAAAQRQPIVIQRTAPVPQQTAVSRSVPVTTGATTVTDPWARFGTSRGTPVTHAATPATAVITTTSASGTAATAHAGARIAPRTAPQPDAWRQFDATRPAATRAVIVTHDSTTARASEAPVRRENIAPRQTQQQTPAQPQQRSVPPPQAHAEHAPTPAKSTSHG